jgi:hypothetical protein
MGQDIVALFTLIFTILAPTIAILKYLFGKKRDHLLRTIMIALLIACSVALLITFIVLAKNLDYIWLLFVYPSPTLNPTLVPTPASMPSATPTSITTYTSIPLEKPKGRCDGVMLSMRNKPLGAKYHVKWGDTLIDIAQAFGISQQSLIDANKSFYPSLEKHPDCIREGWRFIIPPP